MLGMDVVPENARLTGNTSNKPGGVLTGDVACGESSLKVVSAGIGINIHYLTAEVQPGHQA